MKIPAIISDCCGLTDGRYHLSKPFVRGEWLCATDGRIAARLKCTDGIPKGSIYTGKDKTPPIEMLFDGLEVDRDAAFTVPKLPRATHDECDHCAGSKCVECDFTGKEIQFHFNAVRFGEFWLGPKYAHVLRKHRAKIYVPSRSDRPALFRVGQCEGVIMGCTHVNFPEKPLLDAVLARRERTK